jgi:hypothetical protein
VVTRERRREVGAVVGEQSDMRLPAASSPPATSSSSSR